MWWSMAWTFGKDFFARNKSLVVIGLTVAIFSAWTIFAGYAGYRVSEAKHNRNAIVEMQAKLEEVNREFTAFQVAVAEEDIRNLHATDELAAERDRLAGLNTSLQTKVIYYAEELDRWRIPIGLVRLLNDAIAGVQADPARRLSYDDSRPSTIGGSDLVQAVIGWVVQYKSVQNQCNALIQWSRANLLKESAE